MIRGLVGERRIRDIMSTNIKHTKKTNHCFHTRSNYHSTLFKSGLRNLRYH